MLIAVANPLPPSNFESTEAESPTSLLCMSVLSPFKCGKYCSKISIPATDVPIITGIFPKCAIAACVRASLAAMAANKLVRELYFGTVVPNFSTSSWFVQGTSPTRVPA
ncbi:hypothetical protein D3C85_1622330 [compost metagenome]